MPKGYIIAHVTVHNAEAYAPYVAGNTPLQQSRGGKFIVRGGQSEVVEGDTGERHVVIEFPSYEEALAAYHDPAYQEIAKIRQANADSTIIVVEGAPDE